MAITTRYFSTAAAGAGDGTTWADRAQLVNGATWSTVITGFNFSGADTLLCLIGPGTHSPTAAITAGLFANPPTAANTLMFHGCDSSGNKLLPANPGWTSDQAPWDDSGLPVLTLTTNINAVNLVLFIGRFLKVTSSGGISAGAIGSSSIWDWCSFENSTANTGAFCVGSASNRLSNSLVKMSGASFRCGLLANGNFALCNNRIWNTGGATSGNRHGIEVTTGSGLITIERCTVFGFQGDGIGTSTATAGTALNIARCTIVGNATGIKLNATASQTAHNRIQHCLITGNSVAGIDGNSAARAVVTGCRLRNNNSQDIINMQNYPTDWDNNTAAGSDAAEYVNTAVSDYRVKYGSSIWGKGYGVSDQPASFASFGRGSQFKGKA